MSFPWHGQSRDFIIPGLFIFAGVSVFPRFAHLFSPLPVPFKFCSPRVLLFARSSLSFSACFSFLCIPPAFPLFLWTVLPLHFCFSSPPLDCFTPAFPLFQPASFGLFYPCISLCFTPAFPFSVLDCFMIWMRCFGFWLFYGFRFWPVSCLLFWISIHILFAECSICACPRTLQFCLLFQTACLHLTTACFWTTRLHH